MCDSHAAGQKVPEGMKLERVASEGASYVCGDCPKPTGNAGRLAIGRFMAKVRRASSAATRTVRRTPSGDWREE